MPERVKIGVFGKLPAHAEFIRADTTEPAIPEIERWMDEAVGLLHRTSTALPEGPSYFAWRAAAGARTHVGVMVPSRDQVGRQFPLMIFAAVDGGADFFPAFPVAFAPFLVEATALVSAAQTVDGPTVIEYARRLPVPGPMDIADARTAVDDLLARADVPDLFAAMFAGTPDGSRYYGLNTFVTACRGAHGQEPGKASVTLDCPLGDIPARATWLELARRLLGWRDNPSFFWTDGAHGAHGRLLLPLGPPPPAMLGYLARGGAGSTKLWPLVTTNAAAIDSARNAMSPMLRGLVDAPGTPVAGLIDALAGGMA